LEFRTWEAWLWMFFRPRAARRVAIYRRHSSRLVDRVVGPIDPLGPTWVGYPPDGAMLHAYVKYLLFWWRCTQKRPVESEDGDGGDGWWLSGS
jgi:hypothetical protein